MLKNQEMGQGLPWYDHAILINYELDIFTVSIKLSFVQRSFL